MSARRPPSGRGQPRRRGAALCAVSALTLTLAGCGKDDSAPQSFRLDSMPNTTMTTQGFVKDGQPQAFNFERIGCVETQADLSVTSVTLHTPTSGLTLSDWGARPAGPHQPAAIDWGIFPLNKHPLSKLGLDKTAWTGHCGKQVEQFIVAVQLDSGSTTGTAAGVDVHFTDGTTTWIPVGIGLCVRQCTSAVINPVTDAIDTQRGIKH